MIRLADDLRVEKSQSVSVSADIYHSWGNWQGNVLVEGFYTDLDDVFALKEIGFDEYCYFEKGQRKSVPITDLTKG